MAMTRALSLSERGDDVGGGGRLAEVVTLARAGTIAGAGTAFDVFAAVGHSGGGHSAGGAPAPSAGANALALDLTEGRYLLAADTRGGVHLYDCAASPAAVTAARRARDPKAASSAASSSSSSSSAPSPLLATAPSAHTRGVSSVAWYNVDAGLFVSGAFDGTVTAWDTASFRPVHTFRIAAGAAALAAAAAAAAPSAASRSGGAAPPTKVYAVAISPVATRHALVAVATDSGPGVRLLDLSSGASAQTLMAGGTGMRGGGGGGGGDSKDGAYTVAWSPSHEFLLATGGQDGTLRLWDIRRSGGTAELAVLDQLAGKPLLGGRAGAGGAAGGASSSSSYMAAASAASYGRAASRSDPSAGVAAGAGGALPTAHTGGVTALHFPAAADPLGTTLLSAGVDSRLRCWALRVGRRGGDDDDDDDDGAGGEDGGDVGNLASGARVGPAGRGGGGAAAARREDVGTGGYNTMRSYAGARTRVRRCVGMASARSGNGGSAVLFFPQAQASTGAAAAGGTTGGGAVAVFDVESGVLVGELTGHLGPVTAVAYREAEQELFSCGDDGLIYRWRSPLLRPGRTGRDDDEGDGGGGGGGAAPWLMTDAWA
jgi:DNA excision repair protein ERCC-8